MFSGNVNKNSPKLAKFILCSEKAKENNSSNIITVNLRSFSKLRNICIAFTFAKVLFAYEYTHSFNRTGCNENRKYFPILIWTWFVCFFDFQNVWRVAYYSNRGKTFLRIKKLYDILTLQMIYFTYLWIYAIHLQMFPLSLKSYFQQNSVKNKENKYLPYYGPFFIIVKICINLHKIQLFQILNIHNA